MSIITFFYTNPNLNANPPPPSRSLLRFFIMFLKFCSTVAFSSRFFENKPNEICSHFGSEKSLKRRQKAGFLGPRTHGPKNSNEGKGKNQKKERGKGKEEKRKSN